MENKMDKFTDILIAIGAGLLGLLALFIVIGLPTMLIIFAIKGII